MGYDRDDREGTHGRPGLRQQDAPDQPELATAVQPRGLQRLVRQRMKELAEQEDAEGRRGKRQNQGGIAVQQMRLGEGEIERNGRHLRRHDKGGEHQREQRVTAAEPQLGKRIGAGHAGQQLQQQDGAADDHPVEHEAQQRHIAQRPQVMFGPDEVRGKQAGGIEKRGCRLEGGQQHPEERPQEERCRPHQEQMREDRIRPAKRAAHVSCTRLPQRLCSSASATTVIRKATVSALA